TDAPPQVVWDIMRAHVAQAGRSPKIEDGSPAHVILQQQSTTEVSFASHRDADPESRRIKLVRYQINPEKNWGPKARHTESRKPATRESKRKQADPADKTNANAVADAEAAAADISAVSVAETEAKKSRTE
ncbi:RNA methyltransferase tRNA(m5U54)methyltransferase, partial [Coemansia sp. RSA 486]